MLIDMVAMYGVSLVNAARPGGWVAPRHFPKGARSVFENQLNSCTKHARRKPSHKHNLEQSHNHFLEGFGLSYRFPQIHKKGSRFL